MTVFRALHYRNAIKSFATTASIATLHSEIIIADSTTCVKKKQRLHLQAKAWSFDAEKVDKNIEHDTKIGIDIDPRHDEIIKDDWFNYNISEMYERVLVIGNPPFGQYQKLSSKFISHALSFRNVQTIAFILPDVYRKHTRQKILPYHWRIVSITELGRNCFTLEGREYHVPASFFIFDKSEGKDLRVNPNAYTETNDFRFSNKDDFDIFVFGASPRRITKTPTPNNRGYFLKSKIPVEELMSKIKAVDWNGYSCANGGVYWLTKFEFLEQYIKCHEPNRTNSLR